MNMDRRKDTRAGRTLRRLATVGLLLAVPAIPLDPMAAPASAQTFSDGYTFLKAVRERDVNKAKSLMDKPGSTIINHRDFDTGETALIIAIKRRDTPWMGFLMQGGADVNLKDRDGETPLMIAAQNSFPEGIRVLLAGRAQVNASNSKGETALIKAVHARDADSVRLLLANGADPDRADNLTGMSARDYAERDSRAVQIARLLADAKPLKNSKKAGPQL